ncbi:MAG: GNAT family N-acetyltransferase [Anaerolineales bacterium]|nr:GNAT family N-acetyltransferase [Anaerolineales bacterium]
MAEHRLLTLSDAEPAAQVIARSFMDDPLTSFMLPFKRTRLSSLLKFFRVYAEINIKAGRGFGVGDPLQGVAFWKSPGQDSISISVKSIGKLLPLLFTMYPIGYFRARRVIAHIDEFHAQNAPDPHYYLDNLGVLPESRGKGLSSQLIRPFLKMAEEQKVAAYTDTVTKSNVPYYGHFGFQLVDEKFIAGTGITVHALKKALP